MSDEGPADLQAFYRKRHVDAEAKRAANRAETEAVQAAAAERSRKFNSRKSLSDARKSLTSMGGKSISVGLTGSNPMHND